MKYFFEKRHSLFKTIAVSISVVGMIRESSIKWIILLFFAAIIETSIEKIYNL